MRSAIDNKQVRIAAIGNKTESCCLGADSDHEKSNKSIELALSASKDRETRGKLKIEKLREIGESGGP